MSALGELAVCGTLIADTVKYTTLDPPIGGFVNNPLTGNLDCNNKDLVNVNALTASTLNYTTLNPPLPTGGVFTPMVQDLDGANFNLNNINQIAATSATFTGSNLGSAVCAGLASSDNISTSAGKDIFCGNNLSVGGTSGFTGQINANGGLQVKSVLFATGAGYADLGAWNLSTTGNFTGANNINCVGEIKTTGGDIRLTGAGKRLYSVGGIDVGDTIINNGCTINTSATISGDCVAGGLVSGSTVEISNPATMGSAGSPQDLNVAPTPIINMTGKSRGVAYVYNASTPFLVIEVETGVSQPLANGSFWIDIASYTTGSSPKNLIGKAVRANPSSATRLNIGLQIDSAANIANPIRINILYMAD